MSLFQKLFGGKPAHRHTDDDWDTIQKNIDNGSAVMLDVRSQEEWDAGRLDKAIFIPITQIKSLPPGATSLDGLPKDKIVYCH